MACPILLETGDDLLLESGDRLTDEGSGGWLLLEDGNYLLLESGSKILLEAGAPCVASTTTVTVIVFTPMFLGKRRTIGHHQRGIRALTGGFASVPTPTPPLAESRITESGEERLTESAETRVTE